MIEIVQIVTNIIGTIAVVLTVVYLAVQTLNAKRHRNCYSFLGHSLGLTKAAIWAGTPN